MMITMKRRLFLSMIATAAVSAFLLLAAHVAPAQAGDRPSMRFKNGFERTTIEVWVYCFEHGTYHTRPLKLDSGESASMSLHVGKHFQVIAMANGQVDRSNRMLSAGEVDRMVVTRLFGARKLWGISDDSPPDEQDD